MQYLNSERVVTIIFFVISNITLHLNIYEWIVHILSVMCDKRIKASQGHVDVSMQCNDRCLKFKCLNVAIVLI